MTIQTFSADLDRFARKLQLNRRLVVRRVALEIHDGIVRRTPVDTGRARASWTMSEGSPAGGDVGLVRMTSAAAAASSLAAAASVGISGDRLVYITNNVEYIIALERGHSQQAPAGMVAVTMAEVEARIAAILRSLR